MTSVTRSRKDLDLDLDSLDLVTTSSIVDTVPVVLT